VADNRFDAYVFPVLSIRTKRGKNGICILAEGHEGAVEVLPQPRTGELYGWF
jgi:hypothetical protein